MKQQFRGYSLVSDQINAQQVALLWEELAHVLQQDIAGDIVEFGCYTGTASLFLRRLMDETGQSALRALHAYDSFAGLPPKAAQDTSPSGNAFQAGELLASRQQLVKHFKQAGLTLPVIHKGWFSELTAKDVPDRIAFAFLDGDFYDSIMDSLKLVWPRLQPGGCVVFDDYQREALPGVQRAVHDYFNGRPPRVRVVHNMGVAHK